MSDVNSVESTPLGPDQRQEEAARAEEQRSRVETRRTEEEQRNEEAQRAEEERRSRESREPVRYVNLGRRIDFFA